CYQFGRVGLGGERHRGGGGRALQHAGRDDGARPGDLQGFQDIATLIVFVLPEVQGGQDIALHDRALRPRPAQRLPSDAPRLRQAARAGRDENTRRGEGRGGRGQGGEG